MNGKKPKEGTEVWRHEVLMPDFLTGFSITMALLATQCLHPFTFFPQGSVFLTN